MSGRALVPPGGVDSSDGSSFGLGPATVFIGNIETITGSATLTRVYDVAQIKLGDPICQGDVVETLADGEVTIRFVDGTVLRLSNDSRLVLKHFVDDAVSPSALFDVTRGAFAFIAGEIAKAGRLSIDTPVATMRGRTQTGGFGMLSMAALYFAIMDDAHAGSSNAALFDDGIIDYKDLAHGVFDVVTKEAVPRHFVVDDPGKTIILHRLGSSVSADFVTNSTAQMAQLQAAQKDALQTYSLGLQQGPTSTGPGGSSTPPGLLFPPSFVQPINYTPPSVSTLPSTSNNSSGPDTGPPKIPPVIYIPPPPPTIQAPTIHASLTERPADTGDTSDDSVSVSLSSGVTATRGPATFVWSAGPIPSDEAAALMAASVLTITNDASGLVLTFVAPDKTFDFLAANETLAVTFDVTVTSGGSSSTQPVTFTINGSNDAPIITSQKLVGSVTEQTASGGNLTDNGTIAFTDVDLTDVHLVSPNGTPVGSVLGSLTAVKNSDTTGTGAGGQLTWTYTVADSAIKYLAAGETKVESFIITLDDQHGGLITRQIDVTINGTNDVPVIGGVHTGSVTEDVNVVAGKLATGGALTIVDADQGQSNFTVQAATAGSNGYGTFTLDANGNWTYSATDSQTAIQQLGAGQSITDSFTAVSGDGTASQPITVTINGTNDVPVIGGVHTGSVTEDVNVVSGKLATGGALTIVDADQGQSNFAVQAATAGSNGYGTFTLDANGNWTYSATDSQTAIQQLGAGQSITDSFTAVSGDGTASQLITVTINGTNDVPVIGGVHTGSVTEDVNVVAGKLATGGALTIVDADQGQSNFAVQAATAGSNGYGTFTLDANGNWTYSATDSQTAIQQLGAGQSITDSFTAVSGDGTASQLITVTINGTNDVPVIGGVHTGSVTEDVNVVAGKLATGGALTIVDADQGQSNFAVQAATAGSSGYGTFTLDANGNWTYSATDSQTAIQQLGAGQSITDSFTAVSSDGTASQLITVTINGTNDVPVIGGVHTGSVTEDVNVVAGKLATGGALTIVDADQGQSNFAVQAATAGSSGYGTFTLDANGNWTYSATDSQTAIQQLGAGQSITDSFTAVSGDGTASQLITVTINGTNDVPVIGGVHTGSVTEDVNVVAGKLATGGALTIVDADQGQSNFAVQAATAGSNGYGTFTLDANGNWTYSATDSQTAIQQLGAGQSITDSFTAVSGDGTASQLITVTINGTNDVPVIGGVHTGSVTEDVNVVAGKLATGGALTIVDADQGQSNFAVQAATAGSSGYGTFTLDANGNWTYSATDSQTAIQQLGAGQSITDSFTAVSSDGTVSQLITVTINGTNDVPVIGGVHTGSVTEDVNVVAGKLATGGALTIVDADQGQSNFAVQAATAGSSGYGTFTLDANGNWTYSATDSQTAIQQLGAGQSITDSFTAVSSDGTASQLITVTINGTNDAPVLDTSKTPVLTAENQGAGVPVGPVGTLVSNLVSLSGGIANVTDADSGAVTGIALTGTDTAHGTWFYSINGGTTWLAVGAVSNAAALLLAADSGTRLYFQPSVGYSGTDTNAITFRAWDATTGIAGTNVDTSTNGGTTAFSTATDTAGITINAVDVAPVVDLNGSASGNGNTVSYGHGITTGILIAPSATITDPDSPNMVSLTVTLTNPQDDSSGSGGANIKERLSLSTAAATLAASDGLTVSFTDSVAFKTAPVTLSITGSASLADYQTILQGVQYADTKGGMHDPTDRIVTVVVNDGTLSSASQSVTIHVAAPAGIAGEPINLALADPSADHVGPVTVTITGVAPDWSLNAGTNNGDGSWTVQTNDIAALSITSPESYTGAMVLNVVESWTNVDGTIGRTIVADNVEVFAKGSPIFAIAGDDTLTGSSAADLYVFAQPIGHDIIHAFDVAHDRIDLIGYGLAGFDDVISHTTMDASGDTVITLADGQSITLDGIAVASLSANNFVFDQTPVTINTGLMTIGDGALLPLSGIVNNTGTILLDSAGNTTTLELIQNGISLQGGGQVVLSDSGYNFISSAFAGNTLTNVDNTISGAGQLGDSQTILINEGTIVANGTHALVIDADMTTNAGTLEAIGSGGLVVSGDISNAGLIWAHGGNVSIGGAVTGTGGALIDGGATLEVAVASSINVTFGEDHFGTLALDAPAAYSGQISGFYGADSQGADVIDLKGIAFDSGTSWIYEDNAGANTGGTLSIHEDSNGSATTIDNITFANGDYTTASFLLASDGHGGTAVVEPTATQSATQPMSVFVGGLGNDNFVFSANQHLGASMISNFDVISNSIELDGYSSINNANIAAAITTNGADALHGDAVINLGHGDSITLAGVTESYLQQHLNLIHLNSGVA